MAILTIPSRFCGPPDSANGGWACGILARVIDGPARVTLRHPPPLDSQLQVVEDTDGARLVQGDTLLAEAEPVTTLDLAVPEPVSWAQAEAAVAGYPWYRGHPFPNCFVCGPARDSDGLRLFPGAVEGRQVAASPWRIPADLCADNTARTELVWAALDCPSWFGFRVFDANHGPALLGRLTAEIAEHPRAGDRCVVGGWNIRRDRRKIVCGSAVWSEDGALLAVAEAVWIELRAKT